MNEDEIDEFTEVLGDVIHFSLNEPILLKKMEKFYSPKPAKLFGEDALNHSNWKKMNKIIERMGGEPHIRLIIDNEDENQIFDTYINVVFKEIVHFFNRTRNVICKAHLYFVAHDTLVQHPDWIKDFKIDENDILLKLCKDNFWSFIETSIIRIASLWDRIGQLFDFIYFNIRQYERDGFSAVLERIKKNVLPMYPNLSSNENWKIIWDYSKIQNENGLGWLIRRRNLLTHSIHLESTNQNIIKYSIYNHLHETISNKLSPKSLSEELNLVHFHFKSFADNFSSILSLCDYGIKIYKRDV